MQRKRRIFNGMRLLVWTLVALGLAACASMGRPEGGARDEEPPKFVRSDPRPGQVEVTPNRLTIYFNENIQLEDAFTKVVVSPPQKQPPAVSANGKRLTVDFRDSLKPDATYTVDFGDAIKDLNEGNVLDGFAIDFSTGPTIDTLRISGLVLEAETLEPAQGILVGVYSNLSDTAITTLPMERIARTNQLGQFTIRNLPHGRYRIFALNDLNRDYHWDRSEDIAFYDSIIVPYAESIIVSDTLYSSTGADSLVAREGIRYMPNDILLTWFNTGYKAQYLTEYKRPERRRITLQMGAPSDSLPQLTIVDGAPGAGRRSEEWAILNANATRDTLEYWLSDPDVVAADSLRLAVRYLRTDTTDRLVWTTDTLRFFFREPKKKEKKKKDDEPEAPLFVVDSITGDTTFLPPPDMEWLALQLKGGSQQDVHKPLIMTANLPLAKLDSAGVHLEELVDTVWTPRPAAFHPDSVDSYRRLVMDWKWIPGAKYRLTVDTMAATSIYGPWNRPFTQEISVRQLEDYSNLTFTMPGTTDEQMVVQLLNSSDAPLYQTVKPRGSDKAELRFLTPGTYYARAFIDANGNGKWDTGSPLDSLQPEEVYYYPKKLDLKKNWDVEQAWDINELPVDAQKPYAIKKNKPKLKRGEKAPGEDEENEDEEGYDPFGSNPFGGQGNYGSGSNRRPGGGLRPSTGSNMLRR